ncbi:MAG: hypothetical protein H8E13_00205 [Actinobacteria bacterium]|nr:hypothetical protein [Actinomycetota bacterium]
MGMDSIKKKSNFIKIFIICLLVISFLLTGMSCKSLSFIPGASYGYYVWEDKEDNIHIQWSIDRRESEFNGWMATDGKISNYDLLEWEAEDKVGINSEKNKIEFDAALSENDYSDEIVIAVTDYSYLEFELKINDGYDLSRTNLGEFLNSPDGGIFKIEKGYFDNLKKVPWYQKHPGSGFFYKLSTDILFTLIFIFILGIVAIEIIRITIIRRNRKYNWYLILLYGVLILVDFGVYLFLTKLSFI